MKNNKQENVKPFNFNLPESTSLYLETFADDLRERLIDAMVLMNGYFIKKFYLQKTANFIFCNSFFM